MTMSIRVTFRLDRDLPESLALSPILKTNVSIDLFDAERLDSVLSDLELLEAGIVSAISVDCGLDHVTCWDEPTRLATLFEKVRFLRVGPGSNRSGSFRYFPRTLLGA
jgi:hypothetical protein